MEYTVEDINEQDFRQLVLDLHKQGYFKGDPHRMQADFKLHRGSIDFVAIVYKDGEGRPFAFCGADIFKTSKGEIKGMIHCQGVIQSHRGHGYSVQLLKDIEKRLPEDLTEMLSVCNPISARSHQKVGYIVIHPGRITKTGKRSQIRLKKDMRA